MSETFDIGPLTWVNEQINQLLDIVLANLTTVQNDITDTAPLRFSQTHLYQATGALDMVGLNGCKRLCNELEKLTGKLEKKSIEATPELITSLIKAVDSLKKYLQDLLNGAPDNSLRLYSVLNPLVLAQGETLDESELFFPDTSYSAPKDLPTKEIAESEFASVMSKQRLIYQTSLLEWLKTKHHSATNSMTEAVNNVYQIQTKKSNKTLWWAASAFIESLEQSDIAEQSAAKKLCRKLDQELRQLSLGTAKPHANLLRDILYFVAISNVVSTSILKVKEVFELDALIDKKTLSKPNKRDFDEVELDSLAQLVANLKHLREQWNEVSSSLELSNIDTNDYATPLAVNNVLITQFANSLSTSVDLTQALSQLEFIELYAALQQVSSDLRDDDSKVNYGALVQVAATLNLLETSLQHYQHLTVDQIQKLQLEKRRLEALSTGIIYKELATDNVGNLDRETSIAVVKQIKESLKIIEQALDTYFRNPLDKSALVLAPHPLNQLVAVFEMLNLSVPASIAKASGQCVTLFQQEEYSQNQDDFILVAESLSMVGLYVDEMPRVRPESEQALQNALTRLVSMLKSAGIEFINQNTAKHATPEIEVSDTDAATFNDFTSNNTDSIESTNQFDANLLENKLLQNPIESISTYITDNKISEEISNDVILIDRAIDDELLDIYLTEAEEVLANIAQNCQALRINQSDYEALIELCRSYHTLKGSGRTVGLSALGDIAGQIELFLNHIIELKTHLNTKQINKIEQISGNFAGWTAELRINNQVEINQTIIGALLIELDDLDEKSNIQKVTKKSEPQVLIGGTRKMSRALYNIFINESMQNITLIEQDAAKIMAKTSSSPSASAMVAVHTLASNALAAQFTPIGVLGRSLEAWLDETNAWTSQHSALYSNVAKSLSNMWQRASELKNPRSSKTLVDLLNEATQKAKQQKILPDTDNSLATHLSTIEVVTTTDAENVADSNLKVANEFNYTLPPMVEEIAKEAVISEELNREQESDVAFSQTYDSEAQNQTKIKPDLQKNNPDLKFAAQGTEKADLAITLSTQGENSAINANIARVDEELLTLFIEEAREIMPLMGSDLRAWRANPLQIEYADSLQRSLHTLKGSARMAAQTKLGDAVHEFEDQVMRSLKRSAGTIEFDRLFVAFDNVGSIFDLAQSQSAKGDDQALLKSNAPAPTRSLDRNAQFLRMRADALDRLINEAGEISIIRSRIDREVSGVKQSSNDLTESVTRLRSYLRELEIEAETQMQSRLSVLQEANETFDPLEFDRFTRLQELTRMIAESVNDVATIQQNMLTNLGQSEAALQQQDRMNRELQQTLLNVRMLPFKQISERMHRIVRQTGRELNKAVSLVIDGESTEIDRSVLEKLGPPLEHLLRNAVAHGLETSEERIKKHKSEIGTITLKVRQQNDEISINVSDDGAGISLIRVKAKAIESNLYKASDEISEQTLLSLIFEPGFSTSAKISQIAGRGVGLDVVRNDISSLGGRVDLVNDFGKGTSFNINLPVTLTVAQVLLVRAGESLYGIPVGMIEQAQKIKQYDLALVYENGAVSWGNERFPIHYLTKLLDYTHTINSQSYNSLLLLRVGTERIALHVDEVLSNQEVVMKPIGSQLARVPGIVGATVAADGNIMFILSPVQLVARETLSAGSLTVKTAKVAVAQAKINVLVVDDSLTMRKVLGRLLEREGFEVTLAKDGLDAMQVLLQLTPDAILTDIEMPRMDGFGLARNIRDDARTARTPLIMISSRTADKHQNLAKEIGVDAFFGKPVHDDELVSKVLELIKVKKLH